MVFVFDKEISPPEINYNVFHTILIDLRVYLITRPFAFEIVIKESIKRFFKIFIFTIIIRFVYNFHQFYRIWLIYDAFYIDFYTVISVAVRPPLIEGIPLFSHAEHKRDAFVDSGTSLKHSFVPGFSIHNAYHAIKLLLITTLISPFLAILTCIALDVLSK